MCPSSVFARIRDKGKNEDLIALIRSSSSSARLQGREGITQRGAGNLHQPGKGLTQLENKKERPRYRNSADDQGANEDWIRTREEAKAGENHGEPKNKNYQEWQGKRASRLFKKQKPRLGQISRSLYRSILDDSLSVVLRREMQYYSGHVLASTSDFHGRLFRRARLALSPDPFDHWIDGLTKLLAR